jgi:hypothetical protein
MTKRAPQRFRFTAPLEKQPGRYGWSYVEFPYDVHAIFGKRGEVRVKCLFNGVPADRALMPTRSGIHILALNMELRERAKVGRPGDMVTVELWPDPEPQRIDIPEELSDTLELMPDFKAAWERLTPGRRRDLCRWIVSAKTIATREKRIADLVRRATAGEHPFKKG